MRMTGAELVVHCLEQLDVRHAFGLCGHGNLALLDALADSRINFISTYHEQVATHAADAYFRISGKPGVVITTIGPGLTNTVTALLDAQMDGSAVVVIAGDVPVDYIGKGALQELQLHEDASQAQIFRPFTKRVFRPLKVEQIPDMLARAFSTAVSGCPGPVLVSVPLDLFSAHCDMAVPDVRLRQLGEQRVRGDARAIEEAARLLVEAERPLIYAGGGAIASGASDVITELAEHLGIPVATSMSGQGAIPEDHPLSAGFTGTVGTPVANDLVKDCDVVLALGTRFPEMDASSWRNDYFLQVPPTKLIHVDIEPFEIGKIYETHVGIVGDVRAVTEDLLQAVRRRTAKRNWMTSERIQLLQEKKARWAAELESIQLSPELPMHPARVLREVRRLLPRDGILVSGVGIRHAVGQHFPIYEPRTLIVASGYGTMGQEMPAPLGAKLAAPDKPVVAVVGDGAFHNLPMAVGTAAAYQIPVVWIVLNNGGYASIAVYQAKHFGRYFSTYFETPDGARAPSSITALAAAYGVQATMVEHPDDLEPAISAALSSGAPYVIEVKVTDRPSIRASGHWDVNDMLARVRHGS